jgi:hypothetical protein
MSFPEDVLVGLAVDLSYSMKESIRNDDGQSSRLESVETAFRHVAASVESVLETEAAAVVARSIDVFAYGFGVKRRGCGDLFYMLGLRTETDCCDAEMTAARERLRVSAARWNLEYWCYLAPKYFTLPREYVALANQLDRDRLAGARLVWYLNGANVLKGVALGLFDPPPEAAGRSMVSRVLAGAAAGARKGAFETPPVTGTSVLGTLISHRFGGLEAALEVARGMVRRELLNLLTDPAQPQQDTTLSIKRLSAVLKQETLVCDAYDDYIYGDTPMRAALTEVRARFNRELTHRERATRSLLIVISDGESTDGDPTAAISEIWSLGVTVVCCYVTSQDVTDPFRLYGAAEPSWGPGARSMFELASPVGGLATALSGTRWVCEANARLFIQLNHSAVLSEFLARVVAWGTVEGEVPTEPQ